MSTSKKETNVDIVAKFLYILPLIGMVIAIIVFFILKKTPPPPLVTPTPSAIIIIQTRIVVVTSTPIPTETVTNTAESGIPSTDLQNPAENLFLRETETPIVTYTPTATP